MYVTKTISKGEKARAVFGAVVSASTMVMATALMFAMQAPVA